MGRRLLSLVVLLVSVPIGCTRDPCERLCARTSRAIAGCIDQWPATWEDLGATSRRNFEAACANRWSEVRVDLEPRELTDAYAQCKEAQAELANLDTGGTTCDVLRAAYLGQ